jgi:hypothetical protein
MHRITISKASKRLNVVNLKRYQNAKTRVTTIYAPPSIRLRGVACSSLQAGHLLRSTSHACRNLHDKGALSVALGGAHPVRALL